jgi:dynein heavy chain 1
VVTTTLFLSFDTDTGLKQALATVNDYNPLMKDFPINDLLSATELDRIRTSVQVPLYFFRLAETYFFKIYRTGTEF